MGCNCNKNKNNSGENQQPQQPQFRKQEIQEQSLVKKKMSMLQSFATAIASRGLQDNKVNKPVKQLRVLSCFQENTIVVDVAVAIKKELG